MAGCAARGLSGRYALGALRSRGRRHLGYPRRGRGREHGGGAAARQRPEGRRFTPADPTAYAYRPDSL